MNFIQVFGTECNGIWNGNLGMGSKRGIGKRYVRLRKMVIQVRVLHVNIYNNKGAEDE